MSIETTLTLATAAGILVVAVILRGLVHGVARLWVALGGADGVKGYRDRIETALPRVPVRQRVRTIGRGAGALGIYVIAVVARAAAIVIHLVTVGASAVIHWVAVGTSKAWTGYVAVYEWLEPRSRSGAHRAKLGWAASVAAVQELYWANSSDDDLTPNVIGINPGLAGAGPVVTAGLRARVLEGSSWDAERGAAA